MSERRSSTGLQQRLKVAESTSEGASRDPVFARIAGIPVVTIPVAHYADLMARAAGTMGAIPLGRSDARYDRYTRNGAVARPSTIDRDPEVAAFLRKRFALADTLDGAHAACRDRFGPDRTPSVSRIARMRVRDQRGR